MKRTHGVSIGWVIGLALALGAIGTGIVLGEPLQVMMNAASICLACIGVG